MLITQEEKIIIKNAIWKHEILQNKKFIVYLMSINKEEEILEKQKNI